MAKDSMDKLGYSEGQAHARAAPAAGAYSEEGRKEGASTRRAKRGGARARGRRSRVRSRARAGEGFIAGLHIERKKGFFEGLFSSKPRGGHG
jgi:hypothetical protein